jgi:antitoxin VapB
MTHLAKLFTNGRSQAVRLPAAYRFDTNEVFIRKDEVTGDVILSRKPASWDDFFIALKGNSIPPDFLGKEDRTGEMGEAEGTQDRDPFEGWTE